MGALYWVPVLFVFGGFCVKMQATLLAQFILTLARYITMTHPPTPATMPNTGPAPVPSLQGITVLVVDDEYECRRMIASILQVCGAKVITADGFVEALELLNQQHPDVLISDLDMPGKDGYALIRWIRTLSLHRHIPAAALSAHDNPEDWEKARAAGFQMHIGKPIEVAYLAASVADLANVARRK
jgi:CheY-like chemotaxis protein